jgi:hypothetical protein
MSSKLIWATQFFFSDLLQANDRFLHFSLDELVSWLLYLICTYSVVLFNSYLVVHHHKSRFLLFFVLFLNLPLLFFPLFVPSKAFSFFMGVQNFSYAMTITAETADILISRRERSVRVSNRKRSLSFSSFLLNVFSYGVSGRLKSIDGTVKSHRKYPTTSVWFHFLSITIVGDFCTFLVREWIPFHISSSNVRWSIALVGALWQMCALEFAYWFIGVTCDYTACPLPSSLNHSNPLLSTSLAEFWGVRWNPVISKQLQDSIYKPLRKIGSHRSVAIVACFTGSAVIHAIPKLISEGGRSFEEFFTMFSFFFSQGFCLILEFMMQRLVYSWINNGSQAQLKRVREEESQETNVKMMSHKQKTCDSFSDSATSHAVLSPIRSEKSSASSSSSKLLNHKRSFPGSSSNSSSVSHNPIDNHIKSSTNPEEEMLRSYSQEMHRTRQRFFIELAIMFFLISGFYLIFENHFHNRFLLISNILTLFFVLYKLIDIQSVLFMKSNKQNSSLQVRSRPLMMVLIVSGWCWTVACFLSQLPLYILPVMTAVSEFYSQSLVLGSFIRTIQAVCSSG